MKKCICPKCKSENVIPIMYGYPSFEDFEEAEKGNLKLGGCQISIDGFPMPDRYCKDCETRWCVERLDADSVTKVRFRYWINWGPYEPDSKIEGQWAFEIFLNGGVKYCAYPRQSRRVLSKDQVFIKKERVYDFYEHLLDELKPWNLAEEVRVCDGRSYKLDITYCDGRKRSCTGDIGGGPIDKLVMEFLESIPEMKEKISKI